jgi:hypothetical protein
MGYITLNEESNMGIKADARMPLPHYSLQPTVSKDAVLFIEGTMYSGMYTCV